MNIRRDGSSSFGPKNRWGLFPSFSVGWKFTEEAFMDNIEFISFGKIRYGYGQTGTNARSGFPYLTPIRFPNTFTYPMNNEVSVSGAAPVQIPNEEIKWETVIMSNLGLDLAFLENRLTLSVDYFSKVNDGLLTYLNVPSTTGSFSLGPTYEVDQTRPEVNIGSIKNTGVEITVGARKMEGELRGSIDLNVTFIKNEVIDLEVDSLSAGAVHILSPITLTREGSPIAELIGFRTEGLFTEDDPTEIIDGDEIITNQPYYIDEATGDPVYAQPDAQPGDIRYSDVNGDGIISDEDKVVLGNPIPDVTFGFSVNLAYKNFDLSAFFNGTLGNQLFNGTKQYLYYSQGGGNRAKDYTNRYRDEIIKEGMVVVTENHNTDMPRGVSKNYNRPREFFVENASYLRLRNLTLGYTIPSNITSRVGVSKFRVYVGAKNLFTLTKYEGMNPEAYTNFNPDGGNTDILDMGTDFGVYPLTRTLLFGANLVF
jgi:TonB-linked SusC/RagA family outer membrane protein